MLSTIARAEPVGRWWSVSIANSRQLCLYKGQPRIIREIAHFKSTWVTLRQLDTPTRPNVKEGKE